MKLVIIIYIKELWPAHNNQRNAKNDYLNFLNEERNAIIYENAFDNETSDIIKSEYEEVDLYIIMIYYKIIIVYLKNDTNEGNYLIKNLFDNLMRMNILSDLINNLF